MKQIEALRARLRELQEYKEQIRHLQNKAFDLSLFEELMLIQNLYAKVDERVEQFLHLIERYDRRNSSS